MPTGIPTTWTWAYFVGQATAFMNNQLLQGIVLWVLGFYLSFKVIGMILKVFKGLEHDLDSTTTKSASTATGTMGRPGRLVPQSEWRNEDDD
jgi:hypothetical protein